MRSVTVTEGRSGLALKVRKSMRRRRCVVSVVNRREKLSSRLRRRVVV